MVFIITNKIFYTHHTRNLQWRRFHWTVNRWSEWRGKRSSCSSKRKRLLCRTRRPRRWEEPSFDRTCNLFVKKSFSFSHFLMWSFSDSACIGVMTRLCTYYYTSFILFPKINCKNITQLKSLRLNSYLKVDWTHSSTLNFELCYIFIKLITKI